MSCNVSWCETPEDDVRTWTRIPGEVKSGKSAVTVLAAISACRTHRPDWRSDEYAGVPRKRARRVKTLAGEPCSWCGLTSDGMPKCRWCGTKS